MIAADAPVQRPRDARLLVIDAAGRMTHARRSQLPDFLRPDDLVVANDAATLPASLHGTHAPSGAEIEIRLAGSPSAIRNRQPPRSCCRTDGATALADAHPSSAPLDIHRFLAVVFGAGDFRVRTEDRPPPPPMTRGDRLELGPLLATIEDVLDHPRLVIVRFDGSPGTVWSGLARHGRPIQYSHLLVPLELWDVWTPLAGPPVAFEPPSASFALDWATIRRMRARGIRFATLTHAAGISSTGDVELDRRLPFDEPYRIPESTAAALRLTRETRSRVVAIGTTVVRALEHAARRDGIVRAGDGVADQRIGPGGQTSPATSDSGGKPIPLRIVDAIVSGAHEPDSSHYQLLRAFIDDRTLQHASAQLETFRYRSHEFGDSVLIERTARASHASVNGDSLRHVAATAA